MVHYGEMGNMTEEHVTKQIMRWLINHDWEIVAYDFPQSGTGKYLHPNKAYREENSKNSQAFIPDIVACKKGIALFFENKNRFVLDDFVKIQNIRDNNIYTDAIESLLKNYNVENIYYGIGAVKSELFIKNASEYVSYVDFVVMVGNEVEFLTSDVNFLINQGL